LRHFGEQKCCHARVRRKSFPHSSQRIGHTSFILNFQDRFSIKNCILSSKINWLARSAFAVCEGWRAVKRAIGPQVPQVFSLPQTAKKEGQSPM
jgi:hypothetical protein